MGNANITKPRGGFQDPKLEKVFTSQVVNETTPITKLQNNEHIQSRLPVGGITGGIVGSIVFVLFITVVFFLKRRQQRMVEMPASIEPQEMQDYRLHELHDPEHVPELPTLPIELDGSVPETS